jgi:hypothetical protein
MPPCVGKSLFRQKSAYAATNSTACREITTFGMTYLPDTSQSRKGTREEDRASAAKPFIEGNRQPSKISVQA